jgi:two-component SAPR family response regulator
VYIEFLQANLVLISALKNNKKNPCIVKRYGSQISWVSFHFRQHFFYLYEAEKIPVSTPKAVIFFATLPSISKTTLQPLPIWDCLTF